MGLQWLVLVGLCRVAGCKTCLFSLEQHVSTVCTCQLHSLCAVLVCAARRQCPAMDIMLRGSERSIGMCTDAMLYVLHLGARLIGAVSDMKQYNSQCGPATARLFMENMYESFYTKQPGVLHLQLVNAEHLYVKDAAMHRRMDAFLVSVRGKVLAERADRDRETMRMFSSSPLLRVHLLMRPCKICQQQNVGQKVQLCCADVMRLSWCIILVAPPLLLDA